MSRKTSLALALVALALAVLAALVVGAVSNAEPDLGGAIVVTPRSTPGATSSPSSPSPPTSSPVLTRIERAEPVKPPPPSRGGDDDNEDDDDD
ncbi:hypothetical protein [Nonomuraea africana]|uniref:Small secreted hydrophilic protein n=1 Tax=Nonomuraea africana TaxID=46171 RepID=A0ABR9KMJ4_9ACTN|nr:hypothetical protein [Nonomuraea africana]MBE1563243.1 hypothetical protein [Nonomuraea africana]